jgi:hypothetical protein
MHSPMARIRNAGRHRAVPFGGAFFFDGHGHLPAPSPEVPRGVENGTPDLAPGAVRADDHSAVQSIPIGQLDTADIRIDTCCGNTGQYAGTGRYGFFKPEQVISGAVDEVKRKIQAAAVQLGPTGVNPVVFAPLFDDTHASEGVDRCAKNGSEQADGFPRQQSGA